MKRALVCRLVLCLLVVGASFAMAVGPTRPVCGLSSSSGPEGPPLQPQDVCATVVPQVGPITHPAMQTPDRFAWQRFAQLNAPAPGGSGQVIWQTFANQADLYVGNPSPSSPPVWPSPLQTSVFRASPSRQRLLLHGVPLGSGPVNDGNPCVPPNVQEEVRLNQDIFNYVVANHLWYTEGQVTAFNLGKTVNFPTGALEVKANWKPIPLNERPLFLSALGSDGQLYGLISLHILSKDVPNWFWATFEHKSNPCYGQFLQPQDSFGFPNGAGTPSPALQTLFNQNGLSPFFANYRLVGAQVSFTDSQGSPIILGNSVTEGGFQTTASCMTCHSRSTAGPATTSFTNGRLSIFDPGNQSYNGAPDPNWFWDFTTTPPTAKYLQLDFVWSLACANPIGSPPPQQQCPAPPV